MKSITILSSQIGAGKTTIIRELVASASGPIAHLERDTFWI